MSKTRSFISADQAQGPFFVGLDLGGTNIKVGVVDDAARPLSWLSVPTDVEKGPEDASVRMGAAVKEAIAQAGLEPSAVARVGLGSPGTMDIPTGKLIEPVNLKGWDYFPIRDRVSQHCGLPVAFINDAAAAAYGEFWAGAGREFHSMVLFTLGTGIGCGIIIGDLSIDGENSHGAECGHMVIDYSENARLCSCGQRGHLEAYASATALGRQTEELLSTRLRTKTTIGARIEKEQQKPESQRRGVPELVGEAASEGDQLAMGLVMEIARCMGIGIVNLMHTIDPNGVLLGGAMTFGGKSSEVGQRFLGRIQEEVNRRAFAVLAQRTKIDFAELGGDAGYIGAAGIARVEHRKAAVGE
jgi:glucokinase